MGKTKDLPWGTLYQRNGKPIWYWRYYNREKKATLRISTGVSNKKDALKIARQWAIEYMAKSEGPDSKRIQLGITLEFAFHQYFQSCFNQLSPIYLTDIARYGDSMILPFFGADAPLQSLTSIKIGKFGAWLKDRGLSSKSANKVICTLSKTLKFAAQEGWIDMMPYIQRLSEKAEQKNHGYELSDEEIETLLAAAEESADHVYKFVVLCLFCGLRHREALAAEWEDIDWRNDVIYLDVQKNGTSMPAPFKAARPYLEKFPAEERHGPIVLYHDIITGEKRRMKSAKRAWRSLRKRAKLPEHVRVHDLKHSFDSKMARLLGFDAMTATRHKSKQAFMTYVHAADRELIFARADEAFHSRITANKRNVKPRRIYGIKRFRKRG
ncbi:MAG: site-specific integrase [Candidatus Omnitrophica bacterium]|nr:site-specific integrase [Candidatus Omnitrophota bacterium]